jgi:hypothetical protein
MKRWRLLGLVLLVAVATSLALVWFERQYPCRATFERVRAGMTREEVIATVGGPPGDYTNGRSVSYLISRIGLWGPETWASEDADLCVCFDDDDRATEVRVHEPLLNPPPPLLDRLRTRLGL